MSSIESVGTNSVVYDSTISLPPPPSMQIGDVLIVAHRMQSTPSTYPGSVDFIRATPFEPNPTFGRVLGIHYRVITDVANEPSEYTFVTDASGRHQIAMAQVRGLDPTNPLDDVVTEYWGHHDDWPTLITDSLEASGPGMQFFIAGGEHTSGNSHIGLSRPAGFEELAILPEGTSTSGSRTSLWVGYRAVDSGPTGESEYAFSPVNAPGVQSAVFKNQEHVSVPEVVRVWTGDFYEKATVKVNVGDGWV